jgi:hypothetical protein
MPEQATTLNPGLAEALVDIAKAAGSPIGTDWRVGGDDLCDCTFQTVWEVTNPYIGKTQRVRLCCIVAKMQHLFPELVALLDGWHDVGRQKLVSEPLPWDGKDFAMPAPLWYRQMETLTGRPLAEIRAEYEHRKHERPPAGQPTVGWTEASEEELAEARERALRHTGWITD